MPTRADPRHTLGRLGEELAAHHLKARGHQILDRRARTPAGEVDLVTLARGTVVFAEVKTRRARSPVAPIDSAHGPFTKIDMRKRARLRRAAAAWLSENPSRPYARAVRFDAIGIVVDAAGRVRALEHVEDAF
jgi:putative endonuclease